MMSQCLPKLVFLAAAFLATAAFAQETPTADPLAQADALMKKRGSKNCEQAATLYRAALQADANNADLQLKTADALNCIMRTRGNGNLVLIDGLSDTPAHKKIWAKYAPEAWDLAQKGYKQRPNDVNALAIYTDAYIYLSSSWGILKAVTKGAASTYTKNAEALIKKAPKYDGGLGNLLMASYYIVMPWPVRDLDKSREHLAKAMKANPKSRRNNYYLGVVAYRDGEYQEAIQHFENALKAGCPSPTERDFCGFMKKEATRAIAAAKKELD